MLEIQTVDVPATPYIYVEGSCGMDPSEISKAMGEGFGRVMDIVRATGLQPAGPPMSVYSGYDPETLRFRVGFPIMAADLAKADEWAKIDSAAQADEIPAGRALHFRHTGPYAGLRDTYGQAMQHVQANGLEIVAPTWEVYVNDPAATPENELVTECFMKLA